MAKKSPKTTRSDRTGGQPVTSEDARKMSKRLRERAAAFQAIADQIDEQGLDEIVVMGQPTTEIGMGYLDSLISNCKRKLGIV